MKITIDTDDISEHGWDKIPREVILQLARLYASGLGDYLINRINQYAAAIGDRGADDYYKVANIDNDSLIITANGWTVNRDNDREEFSISITTTDLWGSPEHWAQIRKVKEAERAEKLRLQQEAAHAEHEIMMRGRSKRRDYFEMLKKEFGEEASS